MNRLKKMIINITITTGVVFSIGATNAYAESTYKVESGDTLSTIAKQFGGGNELVNQIAKENNISDIHLIFEGQVLVIDKVEQEEKKEETASAVVEEKQPVEVSTFANISSDAKEWIAQKESNGSYEARNGRYIGRYQLDASYLNNDYSAENQEKVADAYVSGRYGSWEAAKAFWLANGWY